MSLLHGDAIESSPDTMRFLYDELAQRLGELPMETNLVEVALVVSVALKKHNAKFRPAFFMDKVLEGK